MNSRFALQTDVPQILDLEKMVFGRNRGGAFDLQRWLDHPRSVGLVLESPTHKGFLHAYLLAQISLKAHAARIVQIAVRGANRRQGLGTHLITRLKDLCKEMEINALSTITSERMVPFQLLLKKQGFTCIETVQSVPGINHDDQYVFLARLKSANPVQ